MEMTKIMFIKLTPPPTYGLDLEILSINNADTFVSGSIGFAYYRRTVR